jgi:hypothetical protein
MTTTRSAGLVLCHRGKVASWIRCSRRRTAARGSASTSSGRQVGAWATTRAYSSAALLGSPRLSASRASPRAAQGVEPEFAADAKESLERDELVTWTAEQTGRVRAELDGLPTAIIGVGIGGNFEMSAVIAKRALMRKVGRILAAPLPGPGASGAVEDDRVLAGRGRERPRGEDSPAERVQVRVVVDRKPGVAREPVA